MAWWARLLAWLFLCGLGQPWTAAMAAELPPATVAALDRAVAEQMARQGLPGVAVAIRIPARGDYVVARGRANLVTGRPRAVADPFRIASITKTFVATAILQLADAGRLRVSDKLARWYPGFPNAGAITVDDLLRMRSGIADSANHAFLAHYFAHPFIGLDDEAMVRRAARRGAEFQPPGERTVYTNVNYALLARIVEKTTGSTIGEVIERNILRPLGMRATSYPTDFELPGGLHGYSRLADGSSRDLTRLNPAPAGGAGAMISSLDDLGRYARALCQGGLLRPATQQARLAAEPMAGLPPFVRYGQGLIRFGRFCGHNGTIFGFSSELFYLPAADATIVINVNRLDEDDASQSTELFLRLTKILFPQLVDW